MSTQPAELREDKPFEQEGPEQQKPARRVHTRNYAVIGDIHGFYCTFEAALEFIASLRTIHAIFFTGDIFGIQPEEKINDIFAERKMQYELLERIVTTFSGSYPIPLLMVPGNYDSSLASNFQSNDMHFRSTRMYSKKVSGYGGSHYEPTDIAERLKKAGKQFDWKDFMYMDKKRVLEFLVRESPDMILCHSPSREYVNNFLNNPHKDELVIFGGHTHTPSFYSVSRQKRASSKQRQREGDNRGEDPKVIILRPGAIGRTIDGKTGEYLSQTFAVFNPSIPEGAIIYTLSDGTFVPRGIRLEEKTLNEYNASEEKRVNQG